MISRCIFIPQYEYSGKSNKFMVYTKQNAASILNITPKTLQRLCLKHLPELEKLEYSHTSKFINEKCIEYLKRYIKYTKQNVFRILKSHLAKRNGISPKTLRNYLNYPRIKEKLDVAGYNPRSKFLTREVLEIVLTELSLDIQNDIENENITIQ